MWRDKVIFGSLSGVLANIAMDILQFPLWKMKLLAHPLSHYAGSVFLASDMLHHSWYGSLYSFLSDYLYGAILGILFMYAALKGEQHYLITKGLLYGAFIWLVSFGGLRALPIVTLREIIPGDVIFYFLFHLIYGLALGILARNYGRLTAAS
jgi:hypothetical protein